jgi:hypothetical protein
MNQIKQIDPKFISAFASWRAYYLTSLPSEPGLAGLEICTFHILLVS